MAVSLQIRLLGGLQITHNDTPLTNFVSAKAPALLAYLAVTQRPHSRDALAALLWGELSDTDAKNNLRQTLSNLRKSVEPHLLITRDTVAFNPNTPYSLDVAQFEQSLTLDLRSQTTGNEEVILRWSSAIKLYQGDFLAGFFVRDAPEFEEWMLAQRARLRELALQALHTLTEFHLNHGDSARAIDYATQLLALDAWREEAHRQLMLALARGGQRSAALAQYEKCRVVLHKELGVAPAAETTKLYERIKAAGDATRHNLPPQPTTFIGRVHELAQLESQLLQPECRLLTLLGVGGVGKTRLACEAAKRLLKVGAFLNGVYFVALSGVHSAEGLIFALANALSLSQQGGEIKTQLLNYLREKELLLVLDNFEQLVDTTDVLLEVLNSALQVKLLVTSRERLHVRWEWVFAVDGLSYPKSADVPLTKLETWPAVQLFIASARRILPTWTLSAADSASLAQLCRFVEGMPLALELAAAWLPTHAPGAIVEEIERSVDFLATTMRDVPARQRSLRAVFEHSWAMLSESQRALFCQLAVFHAGFGAEAAQFVAGASGSALNALVDRSLLRVDTSSLSRRYELHELVRQFAHEKLNADQAALLQAQQRHAQFFARFVAARRGLLKGADHKRGLDDMTREFENVCAGWAWVWRGAATPAWDDIQAFMEPLFVTLEMRGQFEEGEMLFGAAAQQLADEQMLLPVAQCVLGQVLIRRGWFYFRMGQFVRTTELAERGLPLLQAQSAESELAYAYLFLGASAYGQGKLSEAKQLFYESYRRYIRLGDEWGSSGAISNVGEVAIVMGEFTEAEHTLQESLRRARAIANRHHVAHTLNTLGELATRRQEYAQAEQYLTEALTIARQDGEDYLAALTLSHLAQAVAPHAPMQAIQMAQEADGLLRRFGDRLSLIPTLKLLSDLERARQNQAQAQTHLRNALTIAQEIGASALLPELLYSVASIEFERGRLTAAQELATLLADDSQISSELQDKTRKLKQKVEACLSTLPRPLNDAPRPRSYTELVSEFIQQG